MGPFDIESGAYDVFPRNRCEDTETYAGITGAYLLNRMQADRRVVAISAATPYIMGFTPLRRARAGKQFVDVGIAEEHAVTYAAGLARAGAKPVLGSTACLCSAHTMNSGTICASTACPQSFWTSVRRCSAPLMPRT